MKLNIKKGITYPKIVAFGFFILIAAGRIDRPNRRAFYCNIRFLCYRIGSCGYLYALDAFRSNRNNMSDTNRRSWLSYNSDNVLHAFSPKNWAQGKKPASGKR